ncbi:MAG TPA: hypothetical protein VIQ80_02465 [Candidatus Saccharimonadales bacterium]
MVKIIEKRGHKVIDNWIEVTYDIRVKNAKPVDSVDWSKIYKDNLENIAKADVIIAEASYDTFGVGYQIAVAVQQKKPTLLLRHESVDADSFAVGIVDSWVKREVYNDETLESIIDKFLQENDISTKDMRFNFFIDRQIYNYLRWTSQKTGKTKAEILRELVAHEIDKDS